MFAARCHYFSVRMTTALAGSVTVRLPPVERRAGERDRLDRVRSGEGVVRVEWPPP